MRITAQEEYGLRCIMQLARHRKERPLTSGEIAKAEGISVPYANKLLGILKRAGLIETVRGNQGGYRLIREPRQVTLAEVIQALDGMVFGPGFCRDFGGLNEECIHMGSSCSIRSVWSVVARYVDTLFSRTSLEELGRRKEPLLTQILCQKEQGIVAGASPDSRT